MRILSLHKSANKLNPFGMVMTGRSWEATITEKYRFSINGQEKDDEIYGAGNATTAEYWEYDTRLGRRWNIDPQPLAYQSPFSCLNNNPFVFIDPKGLSGETATDNTSSKKIKKKLDEFRTKRAIKKFDKFIKQKWSQEFNNQLRAITTATGLEATQNDYNQAAQQTLQVFDTIYNRKRWYKHLTKYYDIQPSLQILNKIFYSTNENRNGTGPLDDPFRAPGKLSTNMGIQNNQMATATIKENTDFDGNSIPANSQIIMTGNFDRFGDNVTVTAGARTRSTGLISHLVAGSFPLLTMNIPNTINTNTISVINTAPLPDGAARPGIPGLENHFNFQIIINTPIPYLQIKN